MDVMLLEIVPPEEVNRPTESKEQSNPSDTESSSGLPW
jgi:hypothetical protein